MKSTQELTRALISRSRRKRLRQYVAQAVEALKAAGLWEPKEALAPRTISARHRRGSRASAHTLRTVRRS